MNNNNINIPNQTHNISNQAPVIGQNQYQINTMANYNYETIKNIEHLMELAKAIEIIAIVLSFLIVIFTITFSIAFLLVAIFPIAILLLSGHVSSVLIKNKALLLYQAYLKNQN